MDVWVFLFWHHDLICSLIISQPNPFLPCYPLPLVQLTENGHAVSVRTYSVGGESGFQSPYTSIGPSLCNESSQIYARNFTGTGTRRKRGQGGCQMKGQHLDPILFCLPHLPPPLGYLLWWVPSNLSEHAGRSNQSSGSMLFGHFPALAISRTHILLMVGPNRIGLLIFFRMVRLSTLCFHANRMLKGVQR